jgi:hypothetical protein
MKPKPFNRTIFHLKPNSILNKLSKNLKFLSKPNSYCATSQKLSINPPISIRSNLIKDKRSKNNDKLIPQAVSKKIISFIFGCYTKSTLVKKLPLRPTRLRRLRN